MFERKRDIFQYVYTARKRHRHHYRIVRNSKGQNCGQAVLCKFIGNRKGDRILKPLKSGYFVNGREVKVKTEAVYHHSDKENGALYTQTCISAGQSFGGTIRGEGKYLHEISAILVEGTVSVGRSNAAQYAECGVLSAEITE